MKSSRWIRREWIFCIITFILLLVIPISKSTNLNKLENSKTTTSKKHILTKTHHSLKKNNLMRVPMDYRKSSEVKPYPIPAKHPHLWIHVSIKDQRVYLMEQKKILYTMYASTGLEDRERNTPKGTFYIEAEKSNYFYSPTFQEGAFYAVSFLNHGLYLFHSTPTNQQKQFIPAVAAALGKKPSSHGCVHLTVADSRWFYQNIPYQTKVVIN